MKRIVLAAVVVVLLPVGYLFWPYGKLALALNAGSRVEHDLVAGYPAALSRSQHIEAEVRHEWPELGRAKHSWTEVRCGIDDLVTQFPTGYFAQDCTLRSVRMVRVPFAGGCADLGEVARPDPSGETKVTRYRVLGAELNADPPGPDCPVIGPAVDEYSAFIYGPAHGRLLTGRWPGALAPRSAWDVFVIDVLLSSTELGCVPAFGFCRGRFAEPVMDGVDSLRNS